MVALIHALIHLDEQDGRIHRHKIYKREDGRCIYCGVHLAYKVMTLDHIVPRSKGGAHTYKNLVCCCRHCNQSKGDRHYLDWLKSRPFYETAKRECRISALIKVQLYGLSIDAF